MDIKLFAAIDNSSRDHDPSVPYRRPAIVSLLPFTAVWLACALVVCHVLVPTATLAAGAFGAPPVKSLAQIKVDDENKPLVYPSALGYDPLLDEIYVVNGGTSRVVVYGPDFFPRISIGAGRGVIAPSAIAVTSDGELFVCQVRNNKNPSARITVLNGAFFVDREIFLDQIPEAAGFIPKRIAISRDGIIYLAGENSRGVMVLDDEGTFLRWIKPLDEVYARNLPQVVEAPANDQDQSPEGEQAVAGDESESLPDADLPFANIPEEFRPRSSKQASVDSLSGKVEGPVVVNFVTLDSTGKLYMLSYETGKVYVYGPDESFLFSFGTKGGSPGQLSQPRAMAVDEKQEVIYVADYMRHTVLVYNLEGEYLFELGGRGQEPGWFNFPTGMTMNKDRQFIVADLFNGRVQVLEMAYQEWLQQYLIEPLAEPGSETGGIDAEAPPAGEGDASPGAEEMADEKATESGAEVEVILNAAPEDEVGIEVEILQEEPVSGEVIELSPAEERAAE